MLKRLSFIALVLAVAACSGRSEDLRSPCAGIDGSPCVRRPVNDWWMKDVSEIPVQASGLPT